ncbi:hypothetical protein K32_35590 [Kaistia sp. 32K]|uniref:hypothetical protein n=1 Tax=Kaistia sp. 32K TaxID=2795690 RepID=UPI001914F6DA|nr:hypothetical protein [Kaistia sp. 32K]BCP54942.1 hypothetical protein K32_35590 [Kaistia sp. 32K]
MRLAILASTAFLALQSVTASAQGAMPERVGGTVVSFSGDQLTMKTADGQSETVNLPASVNVTALVNRKLSDIKAGDYVGSAAVKGADGKLHAQEVHIFAESMRGAGEGQRPMSGAGRSMTNATVTTVIADPTGQTLRLKYKGGEQDIEVGPEARIVAIIPGDRALLKPGAAVSLFVEKASDGSLRARAVQAEKDGVKPL